MKLLLHIAIACIVLASATARADDKAEAARLYEVGKRHYNLNELDEAIVQFKSAYRLVPDPVYLFNIAQAYRLKGNKFCGLAAQFYATYQREEKDKKLRDSVKKRREEMEACAKAHPQQEEPAVTAPPTTIEPPPVPIPAPATTTPPATPAPAIVAPKPVEGASKKRRWAKVLLISGAVLGTASVTFWITGVDRENKLRECERTPPPLRCGTGDALIDRIGRLERDKDASFAASYLFGVGAIATAITGYLLLRSAKNADNMRVIPTGNGAVAAWSF
jgi:tetratricopeptide (TPR) repeat protein